MWIDLAISILAVGLFKQETLQMQKDHTTHFVILSLVTTKMTFKLTQVIGIHAIQ